MSVGTPNEPIACSCASSLFASVSASHAFAVLMAAIHMLPANEAPTLAITATFS